MFIEVAHKLVEDSSGFLTDYTMYYDDIKDTYVCVFGDNDCYLPEDGEYDWETESETEAFEWFNSYIGFFSCRSFLQCPSQEIQEHD